MKLSMVIVRIPPNVGNCAVSAVATPNSKSDTSPSTCSCMNMISAITPTAKNPGISRTVCSQPISEPSNAATSMTKLLSSADHVAKATGIAAAIRNKSVTGRRQTGSSRPRPREIFKRFRTAFLSRKRPRPGSACALIGARAAHVIGDEGRPAHLAQQVELKVEPFPMALLVLHDPLEQRPRADIVALERLPRGLGVEFDRSRFLALVGLEQRLEAFGLLRRLGGFQLGHTTQEHDPVDEGPGMAEFFLHFLAHLRGQLVDAPILQRMGMQQVLVHRRQFHRKRGLKVLDAVRAVGHVSLLFAVARFSHELSTHAAFAMRSIDGASLRHPVPKPSSRNPIG